MTESINQLGLLPGDRIIVPKSYLNWVQHHAIYLGQDSKGQHLLIENKVGKGVRLISASDFFKEVLWVNKIERFSGNDFQRKEAVKKALSKLNLPYDLINYNCQHFANEIQYGKISSEQVSNGFIIAGIVLFATFVISQIPEHYD